MFHFDAIIRSLQLLRKREEQDTNMNLHIRHIRTACCSVLAHVCRTSKDPAAESSK